MARYILLTSKRWNDSLLKEMRDTFPEDTWIRIDKKEDFNIDAIQEFLPDYIFIPHWSHIIRPDIFLNFKCIVFHMTDLPYGRGGSPLQNLIVKGFESTKISAIDVVEEIDAGAIYLQKELSLVGTAEEIYLRANKTIRSMIKEIIIKGPEPKQQSGTIVKFKRRTPSMSDMSHLQSINKMYDFIRMLDADGYPNAFLEIGNFKLEFSRASLKSNEKIIADVIISKK